MATTKRDYYDVLGVDRKADVKEIKKAYRRLARKYHPDLNPDDAKAAAKFNEISEAHEVLTDPEKRRKYDQFGHAAFSQGGGPGFEGGFTGSPFGDFRFTGGFGEGFGNMGDFFGDLLGGQRRSREPRGPQKGQDIVYTLELEFRDAFQGLDATIQIPRPTGKNERVLVNIPAGVDTGSRVRLKGKGEPGLNGGPEGDLIIQTKVREHPFFTRKGPNVYCTVPLTFTEAALGATVRVPTLEGSAALTIPAGTQSGRSFRLKERGMPRLQGAGRGDLYVAVTVHVPTDLSEDARELLEEFAKCCPDDPRKDLPRGV
jgi:DnaJ-class molecular chaperone